MKIKENGETFEIKDIQKNEMFYFLEKAFESVQRAIERKEPPKEHPLYPLLKWYADISSVDFGGLTENICYFVTDVEH